MIHSTYGTTNVNSPQNHNISTKGKMINTDPSTNANSDMNNQGGG
jgi:hypothetical protein